MTTETETPPAAEVVPAADGEKKAAVKGEKREFVQRVPKPERAALDAKIQSLQEQADKNQARIEDIKAQIESRREKRKNIGGGTQDTRARISELNAAFSAHMEERNMIRKELLAVDAGRERLKEESLALKQKVRFFKVEDIDREIAKLEESIAHTTMPLNEEKKIMSQIKELGKSREFVKDFNDAQNKISEQEGIRKAIVERLRGKDVDINGVKAEQQGYRAVLDETRSKEDAAMADIPKLQNERNKCYETIKAKREEIRRLRTEFKKAEDEHWQKEREFRAAQREAKQKQWEASQEERKARDEARKKWELENAPEPFDAEVTAAEQLITYLSKWGDAEVADTEAAAKAAEAEAEKAKKLEGFGKMLSNKNHRDEEEDDLFSLTQSKKFKKKKGKTEEKKVERLQLSFDSFASFSKLSLTAPNTTAEVPAMLITLKEKKELFLEKRKVKKEKMAAGILDDEEKEAKEKAAKEAKEAEAEAKKELEEAEEVGEKLVSLSIGDVDDDGNVSVTLTPSSESDE